MRSSELIQKNMKLRLEKIDLIYFSKGIEEEKYTTNNYVYNKLFRRLNGCPYCGPHSGCNERTKHNGHRTWKRYRDHQWKEKNDHEKS